MSWESDDFFKKLERSSSFWLLVTSAIDVEAAGLSIYDRLTQLF